MGKKRKINSKKKRPSQLAIAVLSVFDELKNQSLNHKQICAKLDIRDTQTRNEVLKVLAELSIEGKLKEVDRGKFASTSTNSSSIGKIDFTRKGDAFLVSNDLKADIFISSRNTHTALNGDLVRVNLSKKSRGRSLEAKVVEIIERARTEYVGTLDIQENHAFLIPDNPKIHVDFYIPLDKIRNGESGQKALIKFLDWNDPDRKPFAEVIQVLGQPGEHNVEMNSILIDNGFPISFPDSVEADAAKIPIEITEEEIAKRKDFRHVTTITIDPLDAKDFDDAISIRAIDENWYEVGVHIADVTHYVQPNTDLEKEAADRATSVYLVDRVIPMLPEILSNNVCSLRPNEEKLTYAAVFEMNLEGKIRNYWIGRTIINSNRRFVYEEVQEIIEGAEGDFKDDVLILDTMAKALRKDRMKHGAMSFDKMEVKFILDGENKPTGVYFKTQKDAHKLIEEFMLLANKTVAAHIGRASDRNPKPKTFVYRIHDTPDPDKVRDFASFIKKFGYRLDSLQTASITKSLNKVLEEVKGKRESGIIEQMAIRTMAKAVYSTQNIGHYGLGFDYYSHFTSPIRRYPDMMVHRLLTQYATSSKSASADTYEALCKHSSEMERQAADAERQSTKYFQVLYMQDQVGQQFSGYISGMNDYGMFIELTESRCEGMVRLQDVDDDYYSFDEKNFRIIGHNSKKIWKLGDDVVIEITKADLVNKRLDFKLIDPEKQKSAGE